MTCGLDVVLEPVGADDEEAAATVGGGCGSGGCGSGGGCGDGGCGSRSEAGGQGRRLRIGGSRGLLLLRAGGRARRPAGTRRDRPRCLFPGGWKGMFYRILMAPPGCASHQKYMVAAYGTLEFESSVGFVKNIDGSAFFATLEAAREAIPADARQQPSQPEYQFLELWESLEPGD